MDHLSFRLLATFAMVVVAYSNEGAQVLFQQNYVESWGGDHVKVLDEGREVQLVIDHYSGAGFQSKQAYGSGFFGIKMKIPSKNTKGIVTTFFLTSAIPNQPVKAHDEVDFEILGNDKRKDYTLSTNVFANDYGGREQQFKLWFDPTEDFHTYEILWNQHQIVFFVDGNPVRVFKNTSRIGANYPTNPMYVETSLWNTTWAGITDWSEEPFIATYTSFGIEGCPFDKSNPNKCHYRAYHWNEPEFWQLRPEQQRVYEAMRKEHMFYDYCASPYASRYGECTRS